MFDCIVVEYPLPDSGASVVREWQTKTFPDPWLENYKISSDGRLLRQRFRIEDRSNPKYEIGSFERLEGSMTRIHEGWDDTNFHGILNFYGDANSGEIHEISFRPDTFGQDLLHPTPVEWFEYNAKFTDGQLVSIERVQSGGLGPRAPKEASRTP
jgi:hypothetical protein